MEKVITFAISLIVAVFASWVTVKFTLQSKIKGGEVVFNSIGLRYFDALVLAYYENRNKQTGLPSNDPRVWKAYRKTLEDIQQDIRWLRTNPFYGDVQEDTQDLVFVQNRLVREVAKEDPGANEITLNFMCRIFVESGRLPEPKDEVTRAIHDFAQENCRRSL